MELNVTISALALLVVALASIGGGAVLYRGSRRVGWKAVGMSAVALGVGVLLVFALTLPVSREAEAPEPVIELGKVVSTQPTDAPTTSQGPSSPPPDLTHGSPPPPAPSGSPLAALKFRDVNYVSSGGAQLPSGEGAVGEGAVFVIDGTEFNVDDLELVGSTDESNTGYPGATGAGLMIYRLKDGETNDVYQFIPGKDHVNPEDGQIFKGKDAWTRWTQREEPADLSREQASRQAVDRNDSPTPDLTHGSLPPPPIAPTPVPAVMGMMAPDLRLTFEGVEYTGVEVLSAASPTGPVMCCGTPINMDDMEVVGTGTNHNPDGDASVEVYRPKAGATTDVYTFHPAQTFEASGEPGGTATGPATWTRWTDSHPLP